MTQIVVHRSVTEWQCDNQNGVSQNYLSFATQHSWVTWSNYNTGVGSTEKRHITQNGAWGSYATLEIKFKLQERLWHQLSLTITGGSLGWLDFSYHGSNGHFFSKYVILLFLCGSLLYKTLSLKKQKSPHQLKFTVYIEKCTLHKNTCS